MANRNHLAIFKKGVLAWNQWRKDNPDVVPDLSEADLQQGEFSIVTYDSVDVEAANFTNVNFHKASLFGVYGREADFFRSHFN